MNNIFNILDTFDTELIINYISMLEQVKMKTIGKAYSTKIRKKTGKFINHVGNVFGNPSIVTIQEPQTIEDFITNSQNELRSLDRTELNIRLRETLDSFDLPTDTDEELSIKVIAEVAYFLKIDDFTTTGQKAERIFANFLEKTIDINKLTNGETKKFTITAGFPALLLSPLSATGLPAYVVLAGGNTIWQLRQRNINIRNEIMGMIICEVVQANGGIFTMPYEQLPSYNPDTAEDRDKLLTEFFELVENKQVLEGDNEHYTVAMEEKLEEIANCEAEIDEAKSTSIAAEREIKSLERKYNRETTSQTQLERQLSRLSGDEEQVSLERDKLQTAYDEQCERINEISDKLTENENIIIEAMDIISEKSDQLQTLIDEKEALEKSCPSSQLNETGDKISEISNSRHSTLTDSWANSFGNLEFSDDFISYSLGLCIEDLLEIEKILAEINLIDDGEVISCGTIVENDNEYEHIKFRLNQKPLKLLYSINTKVTIEMILIK
ncbi:MAG: hypothetical protein ATN35_06090 [Epulopiscium sp. Nele67-Bin004]|nr:MAG: hypothetical protein ATN35_06090 [Epulopiscium sp. Nele67-Bin004]